MDKRTYHSRCSQRCHDVKLHFWGSARNVCICTKLHMYLQAFIAWLSVVFVGHIPCGCCNMNVSCQLTVMSPLWRPSGRASCSGHLWLALVCPDTQSSPLWTVGPEPCGPSLSGTTPTTGCWRSVIRQEGKEGEIRLLSNAGRRLAYLSYSQRITKVITNHPEGVMHVWTKGHDNPIVVEIFQFQTQVMERLGVKVGQSDRERCWINK